MKPNKSILDESFKYVPAAATAVDATWRRFGWQPVTDQERKTRRHRPVAPLDNRVIDLSQRRSA